MKLVLHLGSELVGMPSESKFPFVEVGLKSDATELEIKRVVTRLSADIADGDCKVTGWSIER